MDTAERETRETEYSLECRDMMINAIEQAIGKDNADRLYQWHTIDSEGVHTIYNKVCFD